MRKYIFNGSVLGAVFGAWSVIQTTKHGPRDWRLVLSWVAWASTLAVAIGTVREQSAEAGEDQRARRRVEARKR